MKLRIKEIAKIGLFGIVLPWSLAWSIGVFNKEQKPEEMNEIPLTTVQSLQPERITHTDFVTVKFQDDTVHKMALDEYVSAVVLAEVPAQFEQEALKAQAVATRTYTLRKMEAGKKHTDADVCTKASCCQAYISEKEYYARGGTEEDYLNVCKAVTSTTGEILMYDGEIVEATYFSCSGGMTEDAKAVWGGAYPYLIAQPSPGEEQAGSFADTVTMEIDEFMDKLGLQGDKGYVVDSITYTSGNGVDEMVINGTTFTGVQVRQLLDLRSTVFRITQVGQNVVITTKGYGHRVGMSQYGAEAMAVAGSDYREILAYYYPGTELTDGR